MKLNDKIPSGYVIGIILLIIGLTGIASKLFGIILHPFSLDTLLFIFSLEGLLCSYIANKKNKRSGLAFWMGFIFGPLAIIYYVFSRKAMSEKEKEIYEWELEKKYRKMREEKLKNSLE